MEIESVDQYTREKDVEFEGESYIVRDNGAVYRKYRTGRRRSKFDEIWTFGRRDKLTGYMYIGNHSVHRIVACAFYGSPVSESHVVDHIDTDHSNNCVSNLRWVTRLQNVIRHPITRKLIISAYGSLENFFNDPSAAKDLHDSIAWLISVSREDAEKSREQLLKWAESDGRSADGVFMRRVYGVQPAGPPIPELKRDTQSLTALAVQRNWKTPAEFPSCPDSFCADPLAEYTLNLRSGAVFSRDRFKEFTVVMAEQSDGLLCVLTSNNQEDAVKPWTVAKVILEEGKFVHESAGSFFELDGAKKVYFDLLGIPFSGESIDDYM